MIKLSDYRRSILVTLLSVLLLGGSTMIANWHNWEPVSFPITLHLGAINSSPQFRVDTATQYLIGLDVDRQLPFDRLNCLLGLDIVIPEGCGSTSSVLYLEWRLMPTGKPEIYGDTRGSARGAWGRAITRTIGSFNGELGTTYILHVESKRDASALDATDPRVVVRAQPLASKNYLVAGQALLASAIATLAVGVTMLVLKLKERTIDNPR